MRRSPRTDHRSTPVAALVAGVLSLGLVAGCATGGTIERSGDPVSGPDRSPTDGADPGTGADSSIRWGSCSGVDIAITDEARASARMTGLQCGSLTVPVDHQAPDGPTIDLALARLPATGPKSGRIGSLIVNPGGPGGSGLEFLALSGLGIPERWRSRFDIVSFDPRGIAASSPLDCLSQSQRAEIVDREEPADTAAALAQATDDETAIDQGCRADDQALYEHLGTDQVAEDLDAIRAAVGDERLTFLGLSYGTRIAAAYATRFGDRVRAIVLDGSVTPSRDLLDLSAGQIKGIGRAYEAFVSWCNGSTDCPIGPDAAAKAEEVAGLLDAKPLEVRTSDGVQTLDRDKFVTGVITSLYDPATSAPLADAIAALAGGPSEEQQAAGSFLLDQAGQQSGQRPDGTYGNAFETQEIVNCLDSDGPLETTELPRLREAAGAIPPLIDSDPATDAPQCTVLPTANPLQIGPTSATDRLLVVGTEGDPATPIEWTRQMVATLGNPATIIYGGHGHTASLTRKCVTDQVSTFLVEGSLPAPRDCPADPTETDLYAQIAAQFGALGLGEDAATCIEAGLRDEFTPLALMALNSDDPDPGDVVRLQRLALQCR